MIQQIDLMQQSAAAQTGARPRPFGPFDGESLLSIESLAPQAPGAEPERERTGSDPRLELSEGRDAHEVSMAANVHDRA